MKKSQTYCFRFWLAGTATALACGGNPLAFEAADVLVFSHGPVSLRPQFGLTEQFNDNIFYLRSEDKQSDFITTIAPGLKFQLGEDLPTENHVTVEYTLEQLLYIDHTSQNALQHKFLTDTHFANNRFSVDGSDRYEMLSSALGGGFSLGSQKVDRNIWYDVYRFDYKVGERTGVYVEGQHVETDYERGLPLFDTRTFSGTGGFGYYYSEDAFLFGEVYYGETSVNLNTGTNRPPGTRFVGGFVGARGKFTEKLRGLLKAGYEVSAFKSAAPGASDEAGSAPVVEADISYAVTEKMTAALTYSRRQQVSAQFSRSAYVLDSVSASIKQLLGSTGRLQLDLLASYAMYSFDPAPAYPGGRSDSNWSVRAGAQYFFQTWLSTRLDYSYEQFSSDFASVVDYDANKVTLGLAIGY